MRKRIALFVPLIALACSGGPAADGEGELADGEGEPTQGEGEGESEGDAAEGEGDSEEGEGEGEGEGEPPFDCNAPLTFDVNRRSMPNVRAYHGITFAADNTLVSWASNLEKTTRSGVSSLFSPALNVVEQMDTAANGDVVAVLYDRALRVGPDGSTQRIGGDLERGYGVTIGPDGHAYVAGDHGVARINLVTDDMTMVIPDQQMRAHDVDFSLDSRTMYVATIHGGLWAFPLDDTLTPNGPAVQVSPDFNGWMDALVVDECGYLWIPEYGERALHRINPVTGERTSSYCVSGVCYPHGVTFGVDAAGWNPRALYMPRPYAGGEAVEIEVGVREGKYARAYLGVPQWVPPPGPSEVGQETCDNNSDDDGDFVIDCDDTDCDGIGRCTEICGNLIDDDEDFAGDCSDTDCSATPCVESCNNGIDDDQDFYVDCVDEACGDSPLCVEICNNDVDDDLDGIIDCNEPSCYDPLTCIEVCGNGQDDDDYMGADCEDPVCDGPLCVEICGNDIDDDGDYRIDCYEPSCYDPLTCIEVCGNGQDDDDNGTKDCIDPACDADPSCVEICDNDIDDDNDGKTDCAETSCFDPAVCIEQCDNQVDDNDNLLIDCQDRGCLLESRCFLPVTLDLGGVSEATTVTLPFSEVVANPTADGEECIAVVATNRIFLRAITDSDQCLAQLSAADTELVLYRDQVEIARNDDDNRPVTGFCSRLDADVFAGNYQLCVRTLGGAPLLPVRFEISLLP